ncbi:MAG: cupin domain-containing protein [Pirellulaceae bacterium]|nr:cupin domain-containing protein [Pirellulaceae bacterium]
MSQQSTQPTPKPATGYEILDYPLLPGVSCPCGTARRGLMQVESVPYSLHVTEISLDARAHYHKRLTETYFVLDCQADAAIELDGQVLPLKPHMAVVIHPGTRHRALGRMQVLIVASPKFDPADEWFD